MRDTTVRRWLGKTNLSFVHPAATATSQAMKPGWLKLKKKQTGSVWRIFRALFQRDGPHFTHPTHRIELRPASASLA